MKLSGSYILITGAAKRIGRESALHLARCGAHILIHYHRSAAAARSLKKEIESLGQKAFLVPLDFSFRPRIEPQIKNWVKTLYRIVPRVDVLINNASVFYPTPLEKLREKDWDELLHVNLKVPFFLSREIGLCMKKQGRGKIIQITDWTGDRPAARFVPYGISKAGLTASVKGLAKCLAPAVQVLGIAPGPILPAEFASKAEQKKAAERSLLKRYGSPSDIARTIEFLIQGTDFMTGAILPVDGGAQLAS